jgi:signal transduction histidine kinase
MRVTGKERIESPELPELSKNPSEKTPKIPVKTIMSRTSSSITESHHVLECTPRGVLVIEDDPGVSDLLADLLRESFGSDMLIEQASNLNAAREALRHSERFDLVLVDQVLPDGLGCDFLRDGAQQWPQLTWIFVTGQGSESLAVRAFQAGARDYIAKRNLDGMELGHTIRRALKKVAPAKPPQPAPANDIDHHLRALSHDMGANLMLMESTVDVLKQDAAPVTPAAAREGIAHLEACLRQSNKFIGDLVTLARSGTIEMQPELVRPTEIAAQVQFEQRRLLAERNIEFLIEEDLPAVMVHPGRMKQVLTNLVRNAARHGCAATNPQIVVRSSTDPRTTLPTDWPLGEDDSQPLVAAGKPVWLCVYDNGLGIPVEQREEIFVAGKRLPTAHAQGTGMGLAIVKKIIEYYTGRILVDQRTAGTAMLFSLPGA